MPSANLTNLPSELHLKVGSYLTEVDCITLSLSSRKLHEIYARQPKFPANCFWTMISTDNHEDQEQMLSQWNTRMQVLPRLRCWTERVTGEGAMRALQDDVTSILDYLVLWEICVGCARYKVKTKIWKEGTEFEDVLDDNTAFEDWLEPEWEILKQHIMRGSFCKICCLEWENFRVPWDVGVCAS